MRLERTFPTFEIMLKDPDLPVYLPKDTHYVQNAKQFIDTLPQSVCFKVGIAVDPPHRFYTHHAAYTKTYIKEKYGVDWEKMTIIYCDVSRPAVAMFEHCFIDRCKEKYPERCANKKKDYDKNFMFDESSNSESEDGPGPHFQYVVTGKRIAKR